MTEAGPANQFTRRAFLFERAFYECAIAREPDVRDSSSRDLVMLQPISTSSFIGALQVRRRQLFAPNLLGLMTLAVLVTVPVVVFAADTSAKRGDRPNIVLIMADDMGYECLSANGSLDYRTPHLDRLAAGGLRFEHCYSQPICTPSRVKLMTGLTNKRNYVQFGKLARGQTTFAHLLKNAGYRTCIAGKWQLGREVDSPQHFGFEESLLWQHTRGRTDKSQRDSRFPNPRLERNGKALDFDAGEFSSDLFVDFIGDFMEKHRDEPFCVYYPMALVHCPFSPTPDSEEWDEESHGAATYKGDPKYFADMVAYADKSVGKLTAKLDELGLRENTLLIFVGDNGTDTPIVTNTTFGQVVGAKGEMIDGGNHVPCVISWPQVIRKGQVVADIIDFSDVLPTICQATGTDVPTKLGIDGQTFLPQIRGETGSPRDSIYMWYSRNGKVAEAQAFARNQRYKLYEDGKMFDVPKDRLEQHPLNSEQLTPEQQDVRLTLQARIDKFDNIVSPGANKGNNAKKTRKKKQTPLND
jgi:arylsulfatase A